MNGILVVNKEPNMTSRDVVNILTKFFNTKKIGHTGTLDPIAEGVLVICLGKYTKLCDLLTSKYKEYIATIKLGIKTDTSDITGTVIEEKDFNITKEQIIEVLNSFKGESLQQVPIYSAVKVNGKKLYEYAREGKEVELPTRNINITSIELISFNNDEIVFKTTVSKGTYIRSLIEDICTKLNTVGTMSKLIRTKQGEFTIEKSYTLEDIKNNNYKLLSLEEVLKDMESIDIDESLLKPVNNGAVINKIFKGDMACLKYDNKIIAIYKTYDKDNKKAKPYIMF
jgi:tRNA pseudouridine55 synthase